MEFILPRETKIHLHFVPVGIMMSADVMKFRSNLDLTKCQHVPSI